MSPPRRVMVDMSATLIHHGHVRLLKAAKELGHVIVALTTDEEVVAKKGYQPELSFEHRIDVLVHGHDNSNDVRAERLVILPRTQGVSSSLLRARVLDAVSSQLKRDKAE